MDVKRRDVLKGAAAVAATAAAAGSAAIITSTPTYAQQLDAAKKWVDSEFQPSTLSKDQQMAEMEWFIKASNAFKGLKLSTVSEILSIHDYELKTLTKAFAEITGIEVSHELLDEGKLVDKIEVEIASGKPIYDFWMNDFGLHRHASRGIMTLLADLSLTLWQTTERKSPIRVSIWTTSSASPSRHSPMGNSISFRTNNSPTSIGSGTIGSKGPN